MPQPIVTLTTDFGWRDHYAGTMKGVILSRCPEARVIDISHGIDNFSVFAGAYTIDQAAPYFPKGAIHVVVVDPGVGTERKPLLVGALGQWFLAPDNGVLSLICSRDTTASARAIANPDLWLDSPSATFHGRDIFAPTAAALASGRALPEDVGPGVTEYVLLAGLEPESVDSHAWRGTVMSVDHFGNVITNFRSSRFREALSGKFALLAGSETVTALQSTFGSGGRGNCFAYPGSSGYIEIAVNQGSAADRLQIKAGDPVLLQEKR